MREEQLLDQKLLKLLKDSARDAFQIWVSPSSVHSIK